MEHIFDPMESKIRCACPGCVTYEGCPDAKPVVYYHGNWNRTISSTATANIWEFFSSFE